MFKPGLVGSGLCGVPFISKMAFISHFSVRPNLLIVLAFTTPFLVPINVSELLFAGPSQIPGNHSVSALFLRSPPSPSCLYQTFSPIGTTMALQVRPLSRSYAVRPSFPTAYREWHIAAHLTIQGMMAPSKGIVSSTPSSILDRKVHTYSLTVLPASSMKPFSAFSPFAGASGTITPP